VEDATAAKGEFKAKLLEVGKSLQALASQVDARAGDGEVGWGEGGREGEGVDGWHARPGIIYFLHALS
jgi:hypothetical protein